MCSCVSKGREWAGLSPFNKEKTASFFVNDDKRFYHCFSSGKHGDAFTFLMDVTGQTFREAVESVASMAGMDVPSDGPEAEERRRITRGVQETLSLATDYYESQLRMPAGREALAICTAAAWTMPRSAGSVWALRRPPMAAWPRVWLRTV